MVSVMKSASIPSLRVTPELRQAAERVLHEGETLSAFLEEALRQRIIFRHSQQAFLARGLTARDQALQDGRYHNTEEVMSSLRGVLERAGRA